MKPAKVFSSSALKEVLEQLYELNIDQVPVVSAGNGDVPIGFIDRAKVREHIDIEVFRRRQAIELKRSKNKSDKQDKKTPPG